MNESIAENRAAAGKHLVFSLGAESYGVRISHVREIIRLAEITLVPQMPKFIRGVINLRGKIVPVMDLRTRFNLADIPATERTCIIVTQVPGRGLMGLIVDAVEDVLHFSANDISNAPDFGATVESNCIDGLARQKNKTITLLGLPAICSRENRTVANF